MAQNIKQTTIKTESISKPGPWPEPPNEPVEPINRGAMTLSDVLPPVGRAATRLLARLKSDATDDPEVLQKAQEDFDEMKRSMNAERTRSGEEPIFQSPEFTSMNPPSANAPDWELIWRVERDICFLYHDQSEWAGIDGDWDYGRMYPLPYWEVAGADLSFMPPDEASFVRTGCLVMILAMAWDMINRSGTYLESRLEQVEQIVGDMHPADEDEIKLVQIVLTALQAAKNPPEDKAELVKSAVWVSRTYIAGYFKRKVQETTVAHRRIDPLYS